MVDVRLLGGFEIFIDERGVPLASKPAQLVLAYLSLSKGILHRREHLAALLWPDADDMNARQNLRNALYKINRELGPGLVTADKASAGILAESRIVTDVELLERADDSDVDVLAAALALVRGELLPGLLEDWVLRERERVASLVDRKAEALVERLTERGDWQACIHWAERWIALGRVPEAAYRALMRAHAARGDSAAALAAFERLERTLEEEYGIGPSSETVDLNASIRKGRAPPRGFGMGTPSGDRPETMPIGGSRHRTRPHLDMAAVPPPFWGRSHEIARLLEVYRTAATGRLRVALVTGEAGQGKSRLLYGFGGRLAEEPSTPLVTLGRCAAFGGVGQPYLPFRDVVTQLYGDVEAMIREHGLPVSQAERLWEIAPGLIWASREAAGVRLGQMLGVSLQGAHREAGAVHPSSDRAAQGFVDRGEVFDMVTRLLSATSNAHPLVVMLDDLQWADDDSTALLFHLIRRLEGQPILFVGAYRTEEVVGRTGSVAAVVGELERLYGDIHIDLSPNDGGRGFVDAAVDAEPNRLGPAFRAALASLTNGNGLFTVELLEEMKAHGGLVRDDSGVWHEGAGLDWSALPARVEGIVRTRVSRLEPSVHELLEIASVVGGRFEAEVVSVVADLSPREVVASLRRVARDHLMVEPAGTDRSPAGRVSWFRFRHDLFHRYLYGSLNETDRAYVHEAVGRALETIYSPSRERIHARLARHFAQGGVPDKASHYLLESGLEAMRLGAYREAERKLRESLTWISETPSPDGRVSMELGAMLALGACLQASRGYADPDADAAFRRARELARATGDRARAFQATWSVWAHAVQRADIPRARSLADEMLSEARRLMEAAPHVLQAHHALWFTALCEGDFAASLDHAEHGIGLERTMPSELQMLAYGGHDAGICARLYAGRALWFLGRPAEARQRVDEALALAAAFDHPNLLAHAHVFASEVLVLCEDAGSALAHCSRSLEISKAYGLAQWQAYSTMLHGCAYGLTGDHDTAIATLERGMEAYRLHGGHLELPVFLGRLADLCLRAGRLNDAEKALADAIERSTHTGERRWDAELHRLSGHLAAQSGKPWAATKAHFERAVAVARAQQSPVLAQRAAMSMRQAAPDAATREAADQSLLEIESMPLARSSPQAIPSREPQGLDVLPGPENSSG